jgi:hypothetical protein
MSTLLLAPESITLTIYSFLRKSKPQKQKTLRLVNRSTANIHSTLNPIDAFFAKVK